MPPTREDMVARAAELFGDAAPQALSLIEQYGSEPHEREVNRVRLAILDVSEGRINRVPYFLACAKLDYRDLLLGSKLPPMTPEEELRWQTGADRAIERWNADRRKPA